MRDEIRRENNDLRERLIDVQARSIDGIGEDENEKKHSIIFTQKEYYKEISEQIEFLVVHRLRPRRNG